MTKGASPETLRAVAESIVTAMATARSHPGVDPIVKLLDALPYSLRSKAEALERAQMVVRAPDDYDALMELEAAARSRCLLGEVDQWFGRLRAVFLKLDAVRLRMATERAVNEEKARATKLEPVRPKRVKKAKRK